MNYLTYTVLILLFVFGNNSTAQNKVDADSLLNKISQLQDSLSNKNEIIENLKARLEFVLENSTSEKIKINSNWRKLERYMSIKEVEKLLGKPTSIDDYGSSIRFWYNNGYINFNAFKRVTEWSEPRKNRIEIIER